MGWLQLEDMTEEEVDRLRTAVVIKTSSAMMRQHKFRTKEEKAQQLKNTQAFGKILFFTIRSKTSHRCFTPLVASICPPRASLPLHPLLYIGKGVLTHSILATTPGRSSHTMM